MLACMLNDGKLLLDIQERSRSGIVDDPYHDTTDWEWDGSDLSGEDEQDIHPGEADEVPQRLPKVIPSFAVLNFLVLFKIERGELAFHQSSQPTCSRLCDSASQSLADPRQ